MPRKCPKGAICFETYTLIFLLILCFGVLVFYVKKMNINDLATSVSSSLSSSSTTSSPSVWNQSSHYHHNLPPHVHVNSMPHQHTSGYDMLRPLHDPRVAYTQHPKDTLLNPYAPPVQYNEPHAYRQVGYLKNENMQQRMLPIFARPVHVRRDKWYYYTIFDNIKVPIYYRNRKCTSTHGCDELYNGEIVTVEGMTDSFVVYLYDNHTLMYDPVV